MQPQAQRDGEAPKPDKREAGQKSTARSCIQDGVGHGQRQIAQKDLVAQKDDAEDIPDNAFKLAILAPTKKSHSRYNSR